MRRIQMILIVTFGLLAVWLEFRNIKEDTIWGFDMFDGIPLIVICILTSVFIFRNSIQFSQTKSYLSFLPTLLGIAFIALILRHKKLRSSLDNSPTLFTATNYNLGSDGGFVFDFKKNNHLKGERRDHWMVTYYWGSYKKRGDTLLLDIPLNFKMGRHAILQNDMLTFADDTIHFDVYRR